MDRRNCHCREPWPFLVLALAWLLTGCYSKRTLVVEPPSRPGHEMPTPAPPAGSPARPSNLSPRARTGAREFLLAWHFERGLPGLAKGAPGSLEETFRIHTDETDTGTSKVFRFTPNVETCHYYYAVQPTDSGWQLIRAWKTDPSGKILQQFTLP